MPGYFHKLADHDRLIRNGWLVQSGDPLYRGKSSATPLIYRKLVRAMTRPACLELSVTADIKLTYLLRDDTDILTHLNAEWADVHGEEVLYSIGGKLLCSRIKTSGKRIVYEPPVELGDFSDMTFEPIKAPAAALVW